MLTDITLPPGVVANGTALQQRGRWRDANFIRWRNAYMEPVGGWQRATEQALAGRARAMHTWRGDFNSRWAALGTTDALYAFDGSDVRDITPASLPAGNPETIPGAGWGAGQFGLGLYGEGAAPDSQLTLETSTWSLDNYGGWLVGVRRDDGTVYQWDPVTADPVAVANAPKALAVLATDERHLMLFATATPRTIVWSAREDITDYTATATNAAGDKTLETAGVFIGVESTAAGVLIWTDRDLHVARFLGPPYTYGIERESEACGLIAPHAKATVATGTVWLSEDQFFVYDGVVRPLRCDVHDWLFRALDRSQKFKCHAGHNSLFGEVWFFFPSTESVDGECDRYVIWSYQENHWSVGRLARGAWADRGVFDLPLALGGDGQLYQHEDGYSDSNTPRLTGVYAESAPLEIPPGDRAMQVNGLILDECTGADCFQVRSRYAMTPSGVEYEGGPYQLRDDGYLDARFVARQASLRFEGLRDARWQTGRIRAELRRRGRR